MTENSARVTSLWNWSWIAALAVGVLVWGLTGWCVVAYRRKKDDVGLPEQLRYNVPIEILYTVVPLFMVAVLFFYTARDETALLDTQQEARRDASTSSASSGAGTSTTSRPRPTSRARMAELTGKPGVQKTLPTLYLPVNKRVEFVLTARDVIHSFWVPQFLQKLDMIPGKVNRFQVVPTERAPSRASAPSCAAPTTPRCCSRSRSCRSRRTTPTSPSCGPPATSARWTTASTASPCERGQQQYLPSDDAARATGSSKSWRYSPPNRSTSCGR